MTLLTFLFFTGLVGFLTWRLTRGDDHRTATGYFLAGRTLTGGYIAGSLLLTNISTEQLVGLNGAAFTDGIAVMTGDFGPAFPQGLMVAQDGENSPAQNFKLVGWGKIKAALKLR